jgi:CDP-glucose 4,6-dehydratase
MENVVMLDLLKNTYQGKKVFLTGHTGFKGAWMLAILHWLGAEVKGYALAPEEDPNLYSLLKGDKLCRSVLADIRDKQRLKEEIQNFQPDFVFHLAAQSLVRRSFEQPTETYEINVLGTSYVLDALRVLDKKCHAVIITTDKVYENREWWYPYREEDPLGGFDPYSSSKACAEIATASYRRSFFHPDKYTSHQKSVASARAGNVIGGGDWAKDRIIPDLIRAFSQDKVLWMRNPDSVRPWEHVLEPLSGYLLLGAKLNENPVKYAEAYNFGPFAEDNLTVNELVKKAIDIWGSGTYQFVPDESAPHEAKLLKLDISKAVNELGWKPRWNSAKALEMTLEWYKNYKADPAVVTQAQIEAYFNA